MGYHDPPNHDSPLPYLTCFRANEALNTRGKWRKERYQLRQSLKEHLMPSCIGILTTEILRGEHEQMRERVVDEL